MYFNQLFFLLNYSEITYAITLVIPLIFYCIDLVLELICFLQ